MDFLYASASRLIDTGLSGERFSAKKSTTSKEIGFKTMQAFLAGVSENTVVRKG